MQTNKVKRSRSSSKSTASIPSQSSLKQVAKIRKVDERELDALTSAFQQNLQLNNVQLVKPSVDPADILADALGKTKISGRTYLPKALRTLGETSQAPAASNPKPKSKKKAAEVTGYTKKRAPKRVSRVEKITAATDVDDLSHLLDTMNALGKKNRPIAKPKKSARTTTAAVRPATDPIMRIAKILSKKIENQDTECIREIYGKRPGISRWITTFRNVKYALDLYAVPIATIYLDGDTTKIKRDPSSKDAINYLKKEEKNIKWLHVNSAKIFDSIQKSKARIPTYKQLSGEKAWDDEDIKTALDCLNHIEKTHILPFVKDIYPILDDVLQKLSGQALSTIME